MNSALAVLVVEDENLLQEMVKEALTEGGFEALVVGTGEEAISVLSEDGSAPCAVITDIGLQGRFDGWEIARRARELHPEMPVIYMTGAHAEDWTSKGVPNSILLNKPFAPAQLVTAVSQLLNAGGPPST